MGMTPRAIRNGAHGASQGGRRQPRQLYLYATPEPTTNCTSARHLPPLNATRDLHYSSLHGQHWTRLPWTTHVETTVIAATRNLQYTDLPFGAYAKLFRCLRDVGRVVVKAGMGTG